MIVEEFSHQMGIVPLAWLGGLHWRGHHRGGEWWWIAAALGVSWVADTAVDLGMNADVVGNFYPITQAGVIGLVFLARREAMQFVAVMFAVAIVALIWRGPLGADVLLYTVSHGGVVGLVLYYEALGRLRTALLVYFGLGLLAWWAYAFYPWTFWTRSGNLDMILLASNLGVYQVVRLAGIALFCWAALKPGPSLRIAR